MSRYWSRSASVWYLLIPRTAAFSSACLRCLTCWRFIRQRMNQPESQFCPASTSEFRNVSPIAGSHEEALFTRNTMTTESGSANISLPPSHLNRLWRHLRFNQGRKQASLIWGVSRVAPFALCPTFLFSHQKGAPCYPAENATGFHFGSLRQSLVRPIRMQADCLFLAVKAPNATESIFLVVDDGSSLQS